MITIDYYNNKLIDLVKNYPKELTANIRGIDKKPARWDDPVWYICSSDIAIYHRYLFTKSIFGQRRTNKDAHFRNLGNYKYQVLKEPFCSLLKIYTLDVQRKRLANSSKQRMVVLASQILTEAERLGSLKDVTMQFWNKHKMSNLFWDFCKKHNLVAGNLRPSHQDRDRSVEDADERSSKNLKLTSESVVLAIGDIYNRVFEDVDDSGKLLPERNICIYDAISITVALLGLATPSRLNSEIPLLQNQKVKSLQPSFGSPVHFLDWPGSKGFEDNQNHILSALAPHVTKAINFFHHYLRPERYYVRFLKNTKQSWKSVLAGFPIEKERREQLDFDQAPNVFTVAYALGFYPVQYKVAVLNDSSKIKKTKSRKGWKWDVGYFDHKLKRRTKISDLISEKNISEIGTSDFVVNMLGNSKGSPYSIQHLLQIKNIDKTFHNRLNLGLVISIGDLEKSIIRIQFENIPTFPLSYSNNDNSVDLEHALFCLSPSKQGVLSTKGMSGCPLNIIPISKIKSIFLSRLSGPAHYQHQNIFYRYGFGFQKLRLHSLRHFGNTHAEKGGIPLTVIAAWSGRTSVKQTLEYIHTNEGEKSERIISTLNIDESQQEIRVISYEKLKDVGGLPASLTDSGLCIQELSVMPCNYMNDFLTACFGCENACYVCGDEKALTVLKHDLAFQTVRLDELLGARNDFLSEAKKQWWVKHSQRVLILEQLIPVIQCGLPGSLVRLTSDNKNICITNIDTKEIEYKRIALPSPKKILEGLDSKPPSTGKIPESMKELLVQFGLTPEL